MNPVRELHINLRDGPLRRINNLNALYQPLHYPLLFPAGGIGWHPEIPRTRPQPFPEEGDDWLWAERDAEEELDPPPEDDSDDEGTEEDSGSSDDEEEATARDSDGEPPTQGYERMLPTQVYQPPAATAATRGRGHGRGRGRGGRARGGGRGRGRGRSDAAAGAAFVQANAGVGREADAAADGGGGGDEGGGDEGGDRVVRTRGTVSCSEWGAYQLQLRPSRSTHIQSSGRLFQELMVDMYCQSENHRRLGTPEPDAAESRGVCYCGRSSSRCAVSIYHLPSCPALRRLLTASYCMCTDSQLLPIPSPSLIPTTHSAGPDGRQARGADVGVRRIILPGSFTGGPRFMSGLYADAMATVRKLGKPDLFVTFTCNPNWPEILAALPRGLQPNDRPDIISRWDSACWGAWGST